MSILLIELGGFALPSIFMQTRQKIASLRGKNIREMSKLLILVGMLAAGKEKERLLLKTISFNVKCQ